MNPAALKADLGRLEPGGTLIVNEDAFDERNLAKAGYTTTRNPLDDGSLASYRVIQVPMTSLTKEAAAPLGVKPRDAERSKNFFALGLVSWMYTRPDRADARLDREAVRQERARAGRQPRGVPRRLQLRRDHRGRRPPLRGPPGQAARRRVHEHHRQHRAGLGHRRRRPAGQAARSRSARYPITPARDILHELSKHKHFGVRTVQAEDEIAAVGMALGAAFAGHLGVTTTSGPGRGAEERDDLARRLARAAAADHRHPARRSVDRPADQDRGRRPQHRAVRPPRRGAAAGRRRVQPGALLRRRDRGGPHRAQVPHAGDPAVRRLPRQRLRAVAAARRRRRCPTSRCRSPPS